MRLSAEKKCRRKIRWPDLAREEADVGGRQDVRKRSKTMEQHGHELDYENGAEQQDRHEADRFQFQERRVELDLRKPKPNGSVDVDLKVEGVVDGVEEERTSPVSSYWRYV